MGDGNPGCVRIRAKVSYCGRCFKSCRREKEG
jgi:hypothetical protein